MTINHTDCDHPSTSGARAKCRRARNGSTPRATPRALGTPDPDDNYGQTPRFKGDECHVCGVEKIAYKGTDSFTKLLVLVGDKCAWRVKRSDNFAVLP